MREWLNIIGSMIVGQVVLFCHDYIKRLRVSRSVQLRFFMVSILVMFGYDLAAFKAFKDPSLYFQLQLPRCFSQKELGQQLMKQKGYSQENNYYRQIRQILSHPTTRKFYDKYNIRDADKMQGANEGVFLFSFGIQSLVYYAVIILISGVLTRNQRESRKYIVLNIIIFFIADLDYLISDIQCSTTDLFDIIQNNLPIYQKLQLLKSFNLTSIQLIRIYYMVFYEDYIKKYQRQIDYTVTKLLKNVKVDTQQYEQISQNCKQISDLIDLIGKKDKQQQDQFYKQNPEASEQKQKKWYSFISDRWIFQALIGFIKWYGYITILNYIVQKVITEIYKVAY